MFAGFHHPGKQTGSHESCSPFENGGKNIAKSSYSISPSDTMTTDKEILYSKLHMDKPYCFFYNKFPLIVLIKCHCYRK